MNFNAICRIRGLPPELVLPKITLLQSSIWIVEIQIVEGVEEFRPELIVNALVYASSLQESQIRIIEKPRPEQRILVDPLKWPALIQWPACYSAPLNATVARSWLRSCALAFD
ncbi:MAG TPA: hypothetical protein VI320_39690 [Terracidiphilus sp.]